MQKFKPFFKPFLLLLYLFTVTGPDKGSDETGLPAVPGTMFSRGIPSTWRSPGEVQTVKKEEGNEEKDEKEK